MEYFHLTTPQKNIWNLQKYYGDSAISNLCGAIFYKEKRDSALMKQAIHAFIKNQTGIQAGRCTVLMLSEAERVVYDAMLEGLGMPRLSVWAT